MGCGKQALLFHANLAVTGGTNGVTYIAFQSNVFTRRLSVRHTYLPVVGLSIWGRATSQIFYETHKCTVTLVAKLLSTNVVTKHLNVHHHQRNLSF